MKLIWAMQSINTFVSAGVPPSSHQSSVRYHDHQSHIIEDGRQTARHLGHGVNNVKGLATVEDLPSRSSPTLFEI